MKKRGINEEFEHTNTTTEKRGQNSTSNNPQKRVKINIGVKQKSDLIIIRMSSEYFTEEEHERLRKVLESKPLPLWRLFREALLSGGACRDIVEKHVMCKLNGTDLKFFYDVNTETRKLIKRSSRKGELEGKFKVYEMSSISTLEVAWEHKSLWPSWWDETSFSTPPRETIS